MARPCAKIELRSSQQFHPQILRKSPENYQLRDRVLDLIEEKGDIRVIDAETIAVISNPDLPALPVPQDEQGDGQ